MRLVALLVAASAILMACGSSEPPYQGPPCTADCNSDEFCSVKVGGPDGGNNPSYCVPFGSCSPGCTCAKQQSSCFGFQCGATASGAIVVGCDNS